MRLARPDSVEEAAAALGNGSVALAGGTELVPLLRDGLVSADTLVDLRDVVPRGVDGNHATRLGSPAVHESSADDVPAAAAHRSYYRVGAGTTLAELERDDEIPQALRDACALAASPQLRAMGTIGGNLLQATRCWYWRLKYPCFLHGGDSCHARAGVHREHAIFGNERCASAHPSDPAAALLALGTRLRTDRRELALRDLYRLPTAEDRDVTTLEAGELILELEVPRPEASTYLKAMDRRTWSFPLVGVAAARFGGEVRLGLSGVAPIPWALGSPDELEHATPLPGTAYKIEVARALVRRAIEAVSVKVNR